MPCVCGGIGLDASWCVTVLADEKNIVTAATIGKEDVKNPEVVGCSLGAECRDDECRGKLNVCK